jgi:CHAD domain-containing protein
MPGEGARWAPVIVPEAPPIGTGGDVGSSRVSQENRSDPTVGDVARAAIVASIVRLREHEPELVVSDDPVHVHQARVATRRLRSDLRTFRSVLEVSWADELRSDLRALGRALGAVRDADVLLARLRTRVDDLDPVDRVAAGILVDRARAAREQARAELALELESRRHAELRSRLDAARRSPPLALGASEPARTGLRPLILRPWKRLRRKVRALGDDPSDAALHDVRIATKRCRYAATAVAPVLGSSAEAFVGALARVQRRLGEHQDAVVTGAWLRATAITVDAQTAFVAGELAERERHAADAARGRWRSAWSSARGVGFERADIE